MNEITLIVPFNEGLVDLDGDISGGVLVFPGHLDIDTINQLTAEPGYEKRAVGIKRNELGHIDHVIVSFSKDEEDVPFSMGYGWEGEAFVEPDHSKGNLSYEVRFTTMSDAAQIINRRKGKDVR